MNTLKLTLKKQWFDLIKEGIKTEEYREIKPYWFERLVFQYEKAFKYCTGYDYKQQLYVNEGIQHTLSESKKSMVAMKPFDFVEFTNGYNSTSPKITLECQNIIIGQGLEEWGAVKGERYFIIQLGREVGRQNCL
jgi:hypothetical protein